MSKKIITISREFGRGGRFIGEEVAKKLGMKYYDKDIIGQIAEKSGFSQDYIQENAELSPKKGGAVSQERHLCICFCRLYNVTETEAVKMMADIDKRRMTNYRYYTDQKWGMSSNYTLSLNSSQLGYDMCQKIIMDCARL